MLPKDAKPSRLFDLCMQGKGYKFSDKDRACLSANLASRQCWKPTGLMSGLWGEGRMNFKKANDG